MSRVQHAGTSAQPRYRAFVSYSHAVDGRLAPTLRRALHAFAKPWYRLRAMRVFRDEASLSANPDLWSSIEQALDDSEYFILLASPEAAASEWVNREVEHWLRTRSADSMLLVLTDGELDWSAEAGSARSALPPALRGVFRTEPRHVDLHWARTVDDLSHRQPRFRECVADLAATLHGRPKDELIGDDVRYHRRALRLAGSGAVALFLVAVLAATLAVVATRARDEAQQQARVATSRFLAAQSIGDSADLLDRALLLAVEAQGLHDSPEARSALLTELIEAGSLSAFGYGTTPLDDVEFSPDGRLLAAAGEDGAVTLWDSGTRQPAGAPLLGHRSRAVDLAFAPDGRTMATVDLLDEIIFWDLPSRTRIGSGQASSATDLEISPDGRLLVSAGEASVAVWDIERHDKIGELPVTPGTWVNRVAFSSDGGTLITGDETGELLLWAVPADPAAPSATWRSERLAVQAAPVWTMAASPVGPLLAVGEGHDVVFWNIPERRLDGERLAGSGENVRDMTFTPDGAKLVVAGGDLVADIVVWDVAGRSAAAHLDQGNTASDDLAVDPAGRTVAVTAGDNRLRLWDISGGETPLYARLVRETGGGFSSVAFSPDGATIAAGYRQAGDAATGVELWDVVQHTSRHLLPHSGTGFINDIAFSPDGAVLAVAGSDNWISRWDVRTGEPVGEPIQGYTTEAIENLETPLGGVERITVSPDGRTLIAATNGQVLRWELPSGRSLGGPLPAPAGRDGWAAVRIAINPAGTVLAVGNRAIDVQVALWDVGSNHYIGQSMPVGGFEVAGLAFSPDGRRLVASRGGSGTPGAVFGWDPATGVQWGPPLTGFAGAVAAVAFAPDGQTLAVGADAADGTTLGYVSLWDAASRQRIGPDLASSSQVYDVVFSPDGRMLASVDGTRAITLWNLDLRSWRELACRIANRNLSRAEWTQYLGGDVEYRSTCPGLPTPGG